MKNKYILRLKITMLVLLQLVGSVLITVQGQGQGRWTLEFRPSLNFPTSKVANAKLNTGFGFDGMVSYRFMQHMSVYGGWGWSLFPQDKSESRIYSNEETGYAFGLLFLRPLSNTEIRYFLKGGPIYNHLEVESGDVTYSDSGHEWGWLIETGISLPFDYGISVNPGLRYRQLSGNIMREGHRLEFNLNYLSVGVGVAKTFR
jgi:hypothetical protein